MPANKNQHYVPQSYFKYFNKKNDFISIFLLSSRKIVVSAPVDKQSSSDYFYGDAKTETQKINPTETRLRQSFEKIKYNQNLSQRDKTALLEYILYQDSRTAKKRAETKRVYQAIEGVFDLFEHGNDIDTAKLWHTEKSRLLYDVDEKIWQARAMRLSLNSVWSVQDLKYLIVKNNTELPFIFSDSPVILTNPHMSEFASRGITGTMSCGLIITFPLNPSYCAIFYDGEVYKISEKYLSSVKGSMLDAPSDDIEIINSMQYFSAQSCVYSGDPKVLAYLSNLPTPSVSSQYTCSADEVTQEDGASYAIKIHGAFHSKTDLPKIPFFEYEKSKRFVMARKSPTEEYRRRMHKRQILLRDKSFLKKISGAEFEGIMDALL